MESSCFSIKGLNMNEIQHGKPAQGLAIAGLVCGLVAFLFLPPVLGVLGIIFGAISWSKGNSLGRIATFVSIAGLILGMIIGAMIATA